MTYVDTADFSSFVSGWASRDQAQTAYIAALEAQLDPVPADPSTVFGVNCPPSLQADYATRLAPVGAWRYYFQAGEGLHEPTDVTFTDDEIAVISSKDINITVSQLVTAYKSFPANRRTIHGPWHEPADQLGLRTTKAPVFTKAQYDALFVRCRQAWEEVGNPNIEIAAILEGIAFLGKNNPDDELPSDLSTIDIIGVDPYYAGSIGQPIANLGSTLDTYKAAADQRGKKWAVCETGVGQNLTGQARLDALTALSTGIRERGAEFGCYFLGDHPDTIQWTLKTSDGSAAAWLAGTHA